MNLIPVDKFEDLQIYGSLRDNAVTADGSFIADSPKVVKMLLQEGWEVRSLLAQESFYRDNAEFLSQFVIPKAYVASKKQMEKITGYNIHHGVMMHGKRPDTYKIDQLDEQIIMLDKLSKNDNVGAIARSAAALGVKSLIAPVQGPHPYGRRALRVSMGYISHLKVNIYDDVFATIAKLKVLGYQIIAAEVHEEAIPLQKLHPPQKWVLLMGNEGDGLSSDILALCDCVVKIEMEPHIKSFNVGIAASILLYQMVYKRD